MNGIALFLGQSAMRGKENLKKSLFLFCSIAAASIASCCYLHEISLAATDGTLGSTSTGSFSISITIPTKVQISGIRDLTPPAFTGEGDRVDNDDICIYTNATSGRYRVTATGSGTGGAFSIRDTVTSNTIAYQLKWNHQTGTVGNQALTANSALTNQTGASTTSVNCDNGSNANIQVVFTAPNLLASSSGNYTGSASILIEPD